MKFYEEKKAKLPNGEKMYFRIKRGGDHPLILIHGNMTSSENMDVLMNYLSDDFTVYAVDLRGFGESTYENPVESLKDFVDDLAAFTDAIKLDKASVAGWSLGGNVAMRFAIDYPDKVHRLVLLGSGSAQGFPSRKQYLFGLIKGRYLETKEEIEKSVKGVERLRKREARRLIAKILEKGLYTHRQPNEARMTKYVDAFLNQRNLADVNYAIGTFNITDEHNGVVEGTGEIEKLDKPVLIIHGEDDGVVPVSTAENNKSWLPGDVELVRYEEAGHAVLFDKPDAISRKIHAYLLDKEE